MKITVIGNEGAFVDGSRRVVVKNGVEYTFKEDMRGNNITTVDNRVFVDGYELRDGKWVRNIASIWHLLF